MEIMAKDYYNVLGVDKKATQDDIKKAFRKLAHKYHPDKGGTDESKFKEITEAYSVLSDDRKRREYHAYGQAFAGGRPGFSAGGGPASGWDFSDMFKNGEFEFSAGGGPSFGGDFGDIFGDIFGGGRQQARALRGRDISMDLEMSFKDAAFGTMRTVLIAKVSTCTLCRGSGAAPGTPQETCKTCNGSGRIHETRNSILGQFTSVRACTICEGSGKVPKEQCPDCKGHGTRRREEEIKINIPAGIDNGEMIRMQGQGEAMKAGIAGDLYVKIHVKPHPAFRREGANLLMDLPVKLTDALIGTTVSVEILEGKTLEVKIPVMKRVEELLRVRGKGIPEGGSRGDLIIRLEVALPHKLSSKAKKAVEDLRSEGL